MEGNRDETGGATRRRRKRRVVGNPLSRPRRSADLSSPLFTLVAVVGALALFVAAFYLMMVATLVLPEEQHGIPASAGPPHPGGGLRRPPLAPTDAGFPPVQGEPAGTTTVEYLVLSLATLGEIRIRLRPDLSAVSRDYIHAMLATTTTQPCTRCNFYRAEKPGILQGALATKHVPVATQRGACPPGLETITNHCPAWDSQCGCHGPVMERGMVAWAGGKMGPDFFIDAYAQPVQDWGTQHTVFGQIEDEGSLSIVDKIFALPVHKDGSMNYMDEVLPFTMTLETTSLSTA
jgi:cyclophilin family peptidyl-prolyl cis-trans isomerase